MPRKPGFVDRLFPVLTMPLRKNHSLAYSGAAHLAYACITLELQTCSVSAPCHHDRFPSETKGSLGIYHLLLFERTKTGSFRIRRNSIGFFFFYSQEDNWPQLPQVEVLEKGGGEEVTTATSSWPLPALRHFSPFLPIGGMPCSLWAIVSSW